MNKLADFPRATVFAKQQRFFRNIFDFDDRAIELEELGTSCETTLLPKQPLPSRERCVLSASESTKAELDVEAGDLPVAENKECSAVSQRF